MSIFGARFDRKNVVTKTCVGEHGLNVRAIGRYIVWYDETEDKQIYYSVRAKKNIDLDGGKMVDIRNGTVHTSNSNIVARFTTQPNEGKELGIMRLETPLSITFNDPVSQPWNLLFSAKPSQDANHISIALQNPGDVPGVININWMGGVMNYSVEFIGKKNVDPAPIEMDTNRFNHISIICESNTISFRVNGIQRAVSNKNITLTRVFVNLGELGVLDMYGRKLSKSEMVQHFIDNHVKNFTDDEILI